MPSLETISNNKLFFSSLIHSFRNNNIVKHFISHDASTVYSVVLPITTIENCLESKTFKVNLDYNFAYEDGQLFDIINANNYSFKKIQSVEELPGLYLKRDYTLLNSKIIKGLNSIAFDSKEKGLQLVISEGGIHNSFVRGFAILS